MEIRYADISVEKCTCAVKVIWPAATKIKMASIRDQVFAKGKTKEVYRVHFISCFCGFCWDFEYKITIDNEEFVAKRFIEIGKGSQNVTLRENSSELEKEVARLQRAKWFLEQFWGEAENNDIEISNSNWLSNMLLYALISFHYRFWIHELLPCRGGDWPRPRAVISIGYHQAADIHWVWFGEEYPYAKGLLDAGATPNDYIYSIHWNFETPWSAR